MKIGYVVAAAFLCVIAVVVIGLQLLPRGPVSGTVVAKHHMPFHIQTTIIVSGKSVIQVPVPIPEFWELVVRTDLGRRRSAPVSREVYEAVELGQCWEETL